MVDDVYLGLRRFLDGLPGGFPETGRGVELKILKNLYTPEEAEMTMHLTMVPEPASEVAKRAGMEEREVAELLKSMAAKGLIYRLRSEDDVFYMAINFIAGIYEFQLNNIDRELAELIEEYLPHFLETALTTVKTGQFRVVPVDSAVEVLPAVATYDRIRDLIKEQQHIAVAPCICRKERGLLGYDCERPHEICFSFGPNAQYYIENGLGREIDSEEALELLVKAEESALVLCPNNAQRILNLCCCCECCCGLLRTLKSLDRPADVIQSSFQARIDPDLCSACETCLERCQIGAIVAGDEFMEVDPARCIGCGLCLPTCPEESITMTARPGTEIPPKNIVETFGRISAERGLIH